MVKFAALFFVLAMLTVGLFVYVNGLETNVKKSDGVTVTAPAVNVLETNSITNITYNTNNPYLDLVVITGEIVEVIKSGDTGELVFDVNRNGKNIRLDFDLGLMNTKISTKQTKINVNNNSKKEVFEAMLADDAVSRVYEQSVKNVQISVPVKVKKKPEDCNSVCESVFLFMEKYVDENSEFANNFNENKSYTLGGVYEIGWTVYE